MKFARQNKLGGSLFGVLLANDTVGYEQKLKLSATCVCRRRLVAGFMLEESFFPATNACLVCMMEV